MDEKEEPWYASLKPIVRGVITLLICLAGCYGCALVGSLSYPGVGAIVGGFCGFILFALLGCCVTCLWKDLIPEEVHQSGVSNYLIPGKLREAFGGHANFDLIVTVHKVDHLDRSTQIMSSLNVFSSTDAFVTIDCGNNPKKSTCVNSYYDFNEQFKIHVTGADICLNVKLMEQDVFGSKVVGQFQVNIDDDIIKVGFPQKKEYPLDNRSGVMRDHNKAALVLSFDYTSDYAAGTLLERNPESNQGWKNRQNEKTALSNYQEHSSNYKTVDRIVGSQFQSGVPHKAAITKKPAGDLESARH